MMESNSTLNLAHLEERKASSHLRRGEFDAAIRCHAAAAHFLNIVITTQPIANSQIRESIQLQIQTQIKNKKLVEKKKSQYNQLLVIQKQQHERLRLEKESMVDGSIVGGFLSGHEFESKTESSNLPPSSDFFTVHQSLVDTDSLLHYLNRRDAAKVDVSFRAFKTPKTNSEVIEELRLHNVDLRNHVVALLMELEESKKKNWVLEASLHEMSAKIEAATEEGKSKGEEPRDEASDDNRAFLENPAQFALSLELPPLDLPKLEFPHFQNHY